jgi:hypothetical protein
VGTRLMALETVAVETFALRAISRISIRWVVGAATAQHLITMRPRVSWKTFSKRLHLSPPLGQGPLHWHAELSPCAFRVITFLVNPRDHFESCSYNAKSRALIRMMGGTLR